MRALITNDDGIDATGLRTLAAAAVGAGYEVVVAAPSWDSSGASASLTSVERDGRFLVHEVDLGGVGRAVGVEAAPAFIARAAVHEAFGPAPDLLLSGVNHGLNCGHAVLHSGRRRSPTGHPRSRSPSSPVPTSTGRPRASSHAWSSSGSVTGPSCCCST